MPASGETAGGTPARGLDGPTLRALCGRAVVFWFLVRAALTLILLVNPQAGAEAAAPPSADGFLPFALVPLRGLASPMTWAIAAATAAALHLDVRATREATFLAHLGIGGRHVLAAGAGVGAACEQVLAIAAAIAAGV